jgi:alcohol dehydrogenase class IV
MSLINYLTRIHFGSGLLSEALPAEITRLAITRALIVTDKGLVATGLPARVAALLSSTASSVVFDETPQNPTEHATLAGRQVYHDEKCDAVIAIGGGSAIDLAKAIALTATHDKPLADYAAVNGGVGRISDNLPPLIAIPTTAGTGSEVGRGAIIVLNDHRKLGFISPYLIPSVAICDPELTITLPPHLTAATGMDALTHCIETYIATAFNPPADGIAIDGLKRAAANIRQATRDGTDLEARTQMMAAAMNGALAFQKGLGAVHAMSHALGGLPGRTLHHGMLNAVLLPHVLRFNAETVGHRYAELKLAMGVPDDADLAQTVLDLTSELGLPTTLSQMGVTETDLEKAAPLAEKDHTNGTNPRKATTEDYRQLLSSAF